MSVADPQDVKVVARAIHEVLKQKGFDNYVPEAEVQAWSAYVIEVLDYARIERKARKPVVPALKPAPITEQS